MKITARGHGNVLANHRTTFQLTTETELSPRGDCIIAVGASHAASDLPKDLKRHLQQGGEVEITLQVGEHQLEIKGEGHPQMRLDHPHDLVFRRSDYVDNRTVTINTTMVARDLPHPLVELLTDETTQLILTIRPIIEK